MKDLLSFWLLGVEKAKAAMNSVFFSVCQTRKELKDGNRGLYFRMGVITKTSGSSRSVSILFSAISDSLRTRLQFWGKSEQYSESSVCIDLNGIIETNVWAVRLCFVDQSSVRSRETRSRLLVRDIQSCVPCNLRLHRTPLMRFWYFLMAAQRGVKHQKSCRIID